MILFAGSCESEQDNINDEYRAKLAQLEYRMALNQVIGVLGESKYSLKNQPDTPYVNVSFFSSPDSSIGLAKCYFNRYMRLTKVEWDSVYLDIKNEEPHRAPDRRIKNTVI